MDDNDALIARFHRRMTTADRQFSRADALRAQADEIDRELKLPDHERPVCDETTRALEAKLLRQQADELARDAEVTVASQYERPSAEMTKQVEEWAAKLERGERKRGDRER